jgi:glycosyltransferase involved in cell wall biosynthesis
VRFALVGTDLAPVRTGAGAIESLLAGWADALARLGHDVHVVSRMPVVPEGDYHVHTAASTDALAALIRRLQPDASLLNNRPAWQRQMSGRTVHLFHNYPDAWAASEHEARRAVAGGAAVTVAAVSAALAGEVGRVFGVAAAVVSPFVAPAYFSVARRPGAGVILFPNRLMVKKGVLETLAAGEELVAEGFELRFLDCISPWLEPTEEHRRLQAAIRSTPGCELLPARTGAMEMARLYAEARVVLCPSVRPEGLGLTALEAQACGAPVVSSGLGGLGEAQLRPDLVVEPTDRTSFVAGIRRGLAVTEAEQHLLRAGVASRFTRDRSVAQLLDLLI